MYKYDVSLGYRVCRFREIDQIGAAPTVHLERARDRVRLQTCDPPALSTARDQKLISILTGAAPDCGPQPGQTFPTLRWSVIAVKLSRRGSAGWCHSQFSDKNMPKSMSKRHFLMSCQKFKEIRKTFLQKQIF